MMSNLKSENSTFKLRPYQIDLSQKGFNTLMQFGMVYLAMEVRTGKTHVALDICRQFNRLFPHNANVLFLTKKKAIGSIEEDYSAAGHEFGITVTNYESVHKVENEEAFDIVICDEAHGMGAFPKPSKRHKQVKEVVAANGCEHVIFLSGTPTPESYSQLYHQLNVCRRSPFMEYKNFYRWANSFVTIREKYLGHAKVKDYSDADETKVKYLTDHLFLSYTQKAAGFDQEVEEVILNVEMKPITYRLIARLKEDRLIEGKDKVILADTAVKLMQKVHQLSSGTIKFEDGSRQTIDNSKAEFIKERFKGMKIAIMYKFIQEGKMLRETFPNHTDNPEMFEMRDDLVFIGQVQSSREGVKLASADALVFMNIDFSAVSYFQAKDRMSHKDRVKKNVVYWIFADDGIESKIYKAVSNKKDYTLNYFKKDYGTR